MPCPLIRRKMVMDDANLDKPVEDTREGKTGRKALKLGISQVRKFERLDQVRWDVGGMLQQIPQQRDWEEIPQGP